MLLFVILKITLGIDFVFKFIRLDLFMEMLNLGLFAFFGHTYQGSGRQLMNSWFRYG